MVVADTVHTLGSELVCATVRIYVEYSGKKRAHYEPDS
jgi:hypothetical protein